MKIGAYLCVYNHEVFVEKSLTMLSKYVDKIVVVIQNKSNPSYAIEYLATKDNTENLVKNFKFKDFQYYYTDLTGLEFEKVNTFAADRMLDCDVVIRLDPDQFFTKEDMEKLIYQIKSNKSNYYRFSLKDNSINYYVMNRFYYGLKDAQEEHEIIAFDPRLGYHLQDTGSFFIKDVMMHHLRGWKKNVTEEFIIKFQKDNRDTCGDFITAPLEIINKFI